MMLYIQNTKYLGMFQAYCNYILYFEENKAAELSIHFLPHTHKLVLLSASQAGKASRPPPPHSCIQSDAAARASPPATFFFSESPSTIF